jgi:mannose-6-phosphate isomerase-like protein (cupin superfamily)
LRFTSSLILWYTKKLAIEKGDRTRGRSTSRIVWLLFLVATTLRAENWKIDPTWLHRYVPRLNYVSADLTSPTCHYKPIFGQGDRENRSMLTVARFGETTLDARGNCQPVEYQREEELYFVLEGKGILHYADQSYPMRANDFTYLAPGRKHSIENSAPQPMRVLRMTFKIPSSIAISAPPPAPKIVNMDELKEQTVEGHPTSVLYKLLAGPRTGTRDAIDEAYVVVSLFWMDFAPGGTNLPHHHETAEEIYFVVDGQGEMVAGGGMNGVEGRHPAKAGDAYYFRPNCTVGFYNQNKAGAKAHILAVRSRIPRPKDED